jgi:beta-glucosidase
MRDAVTAFGISRRSGWRRLRAAVTAGAVLSALLTAVGLTAVGAPGARAAQPAYPAACPWMNAHDSASQRARLLLDASTLDQKLRWLDEQAANTPAQTTFNGVAYPAQVPCTPTVVYTDGPDYVRLTPGATIFPSQIDLAASWSPQLAYAKGRAEADEAFRARKNVILGPGIFSSRTPLDGRTPEFLGEDPLLSGDLAAADINGMQHGNPGEPVMAVLKHYVANEQELDRTSSSSDLDQRTLREVYNLPFAIALSRSQPGGVMCSYNQVNGVYSCQNPLLGSMLKGADGFAGYVVSDFGAVHSTAPSLNAGLDQELNVPVYYTPANIHAALAAGQVTLAQVYEAAYRVVRSYIAAGLFDHPLPATAAADPATPADTAVATQIAERGSVLLKNSGQVLPLTAASHTIAVIGQTASDTPTGGVSARTVCAEVGADALPNVCPDPVAPLDAITARAAQDGATVTYNNGADPAAAAATARSAGVAIVFAYAMQGEGADRTTLSLDGNGDALISAVAAANPDTIVVLETGTAVTMPWLDQVKGVVEAWYPGDQQGTALARLLFGDVDFTGRLPMTFPRSLADTPTATPAQYPGVVPAGSSIRQVSYSEGLAVGYKWYQSRGIAPLFPFGYGLSYTRFGLSALRVTQAGRQVRVSFDVRNDGPRAGADTPQVYLTLPAAADEPGQRLVGFTQVTLKPGRARRVQVTIDPGSAQHPLSYWSTAREAWLTPPGRYEVRAGSSAQDLPLSAAFSVPG